MPKNILNYRATATIVRLRAGGGALDRLDTLDRVPRTELVLDTVNTLITS